jgi:hypothetical protein
MPAGAVSCEPGAQDAGCQTCRAVCEEMHQCLDMNNRSGGTQEMEDSRACGPGVCWIL